MIFKPLFFITLHFIRFHFLVDQKTKYLWSKDEVQTARVLFYLRVIPTLIECLPSIVFGNMVAPTMFLYPFRLLGKSYLCNILF